MRPVRPWTRKEEGQALWWVRQGVKEVTVARRLGRTESAVKTKLGHLKRAAGLQTKCPPERGRGELSTSVALLSSPGVSDLDVAKVLGIGQPAVTRTRNRLGIPPGCEKHKHRRGWKPGDPGGLKAAIVRLYGVWGRSDAEIARLTGEPRFRVTYYREKMGIPPCGRAGRPTKEAT
jgi:hypothetical protein